MIDAGLETLAAHRCPDCGDNRFWRGPSGGMSLNIECKPCGSRFNVATHHGTLIMAQRIKYNGLWPDRGDWWLEER